MITWKNDWIEEWMNELHTLLLLFTYQFLKKVTIVIIKQLVIIDK